MKDPTAADHAAATALSTNYVGAALGAAGAWLASSNNVAILGLGIAAAGFLTQLVLGIRRDRREEREHAARMAAEEQAHLP